MKRKTLNIFHTRAHTLNIQQSYCRLKFRITFVKIIIIGVLNIFCTFCFSQFGARLIIEIDFRAAFFTRISLLLLLLRIVSTSIIGFCLFH